MDEEHVESLHEGKANIEKQGGRIVELGETDKSDGVRLCGESEGSTHRGHMMQLQSDEQGSERRRKEEVEQVEQRQVTMLDSPGARQGFSFQLIEQQLLE